MATATYDEYTHSAGGLPQDCNSLDPLYKWDTHFPERLSRLSINPDFSPVSTPQRRQRRGRNRNTSRFKTQPITFDEIKEVDEEPNAAAEKEGLKSQFAAFSRSMDGLVPGFPVPPPGMRRRNRQQQDQENELKTLHHDATTTGQLHPAATGGRPTTAAVSHTNAAAAGPPSSGIPAAMATTGSDVTGSQAAGPSSDGTSKQDDESAVFLAAGLNPTLAKVQDVSRARRKKRRQRKSIEEEPELENINTQTIITSG